jgi:hypothetical protein
MFSDGDLCISQGSQHGQTIDPSTSHDVTAGDHNCCSSHSGGGTPKPKPKKCGTFDLKCHAKKVAHAANNFYQAHKAIIATVADFAVSTIVFSACEAATDGVGSLGCAMLAGAVGNLVDHALNPQAGDDSFLGMATNALTGAAMGAAGAGAGKLLGAGVKALARTGVGEQVMSKGASLLGKVADGGGSKLARAAGGATGCSFTAGTLVLMADGSTKPIGSVAIGDKVESGDPASASNPAETVVGLHDNLDTDLTDLTMVDAGGHTATVHTTQNHPFWDVTRQEWTQAGQLPVGDQLRTPAGDTVRVAAVDNATGRSEMLNLTVTDFHTYYVLAGNTPVLVHNCPTGSTPSDVAAHILGSPDSSKVIVIGRTMGRVRAASKALQAEGVNAKWYQAWANDPFDPDLAMSRNTRWIRSKVSQGYHIVDIGPDLARADPFGPFYGMESAETAGRGYPLHSMEWPSS